VYLSAITLVAALVAASLAIPAVGSRLAPAPSSPQLDAGWEQIGSSGEAVRAMQVQTRESSRHVAGEGGLFRSSEGGRHWERVSVPPDMARPSALAVHPRDESIMLLGTEHGEVYRTEDGGSIWHPVGNAGSGPVTVLSFNPRQPRWVFLGRLGPAGGVWRSTDAGQSWRQMISGPIQRLVHHPQDAGTIYVAGPTRVSRSRDGGLTWTHLELRGVRAVATSAAEPEAVYLVMGDRLLYLKSWQSRAETFLLPGIGDFLEVHPQASDLLYVATARPTSGIWRSTDRGETWVLYSEGLGSPVISSLALDADGQALYVGTLTLGLWRYSPAGPEGEAPP
jgi:photosystem II stability/assembly factor-like uncharacterized protein